MGWFSQQEVESMKDADNSAGSFIGFPAPCALGVGSWSWKELPKVAL